MHLTVFTKALYTEFTVVLGIASLFNLATLGFLSHLISYHMMLQKRGLTTYEYLRGDTPRISSVYTKEKREIATDGEVTDPLK